MFANLLFIVPLVIALCGVAVIVYSLTRETRRTDMFSSLVANVGHVLKHCVLFSVCLLSSIFGLFFMYLGFTGSWDPMTILMSMMGVMGLLATLQFYIMPGCEWLGWWEDKTR